MTPVYDGYNYHTFHQITSNDQFIKAGESFPSEVTVYTSSGTTIDISTLWQDKPLVLETGSSSCPLYWHSETSMSWLASTHADKAIIERNQEGVNSRYYVPGPLSTMEDYTWRFLSWYLEVMKQPVGTEPGSRWPVAVKLSG